MVDGLIDFEHQRRGIARTEPRAPRAADKEPALDAGAQDSDGSRRSGSRRGGQSLVTKVASRERAAILSQDLAPLSQAALTLASGRPSGRAPDPQP